MKTSVLIEAGGFLIGYHNLVVDMRGLPIRDNLHSGF